MVLPETRTLPIHKRDADVPLSTHSSFSPQSEFLTIRSLCWIRKKKKEHYLLEELVKGLGRSQESNQFVKYLSKRDLEYHLFQSPF